MNQTNRCSFDGGMCSLECKKYPMCAYMSIQKQLSELQKQIEFIYQSMNSIINNEVKLQSSLDNTNEKLHNYVCELLDIYNQNSELNKESQSEEESK